MYFTQLAQVPHIRGCPAMYRRKKWVALGAFCVLAASYWGRTPIVNACRPMWQVCVPCVQYVFVPCPAPGPSKPERDQRSRKVKMLFIVDNLDKEIGEPIAVESTKMQGLLLQALPAE